MDTNGMNRWALGIRQYEGWYPGSRSYRNCNPGNFRAIARADGLPTSGYLRSLGATGVSGGFAVFPSAEAGFAALLQFLRDARANQLIAYRAYAKAHGRPGNMCTLQDFCNVYAPSSDDNDPGRYAKWIADFIGNGVEVGTPIDQI